MTSPAAAADELWRVASDVELQRHLDASMPHRGTSPNPSPNGLQVVPRGLCVELLGDLVRAMLKQNAWKIDFQPVPGGRKSQPWRATKSPLQTELQTITVLDGGVGTSEAFDFGCNLSDDAPGSPAVQ